MGLATGKATFETEVPSWEHWRSKHLSHSQFVYTQNEEVLGWIALSAVSTRKVYEGVAEVSIYVDPKHAGIGIGNSLMNQLIKSSEAHGIWTLQSSVFPENEATIRLHLKNGFRKIGKREKIARLHGQWKDTIILERRSSLVGTV